MTDSFTYMGVWFLPDNPDNQVTGTLTFDLQVGIELELMGKLVGFRSSKDIHEPKFIIGLTTDGTVLTLYKCFQSNRSMSHNGLETCKYSMISILKGAHFETEADIIFNSVTGRLKNLEEWISEFGFKKVDTDFKTKTTEIDYELPSPIEFKATPALTGKLNFTYSPPFSRHTSKVELVQKVSVILETKTAKSF